MSAEVTKRAAEELANTINRTPTSLNGFIALLSPQSKLLLREALKSEPKCDLSFDHRVGDLNHEFVKADVDQDGVLTMEEFKKYLETKTAEASEPPSRKKLTYVALQNGIPFVGFGFLDNAIMIIAGDTIESTFGVALGLSTLMAAGMGNLIADVAGVGFRGTIEAISSKLGVPDPQLTNAQRDMRTVQIAANVGSMIGVFIGCVLGLCPLIFLHKNEDERADDKTQAAQ